MALTITDNSVRQINAALLSLEKKIGETNSEKAQDKRAVQMELKNVQYDFMAPLYQSGNSVGIDTTGTWEGNARSATTAEHAITADNAEHADTATSADTATTAETAKNMYVQYLDLSALDKTKFYPLVCYTWVNFAEVAICSESGSGSMEYNQNRIHFDISTSGWSDMRYTLNIREYTCYENNEITIGCIGRGVNYGAWAIWLRGGLHYNCWSRDCDLSLKTSDFTFHNEIYTVGTNYYGGANVHVSIIFTPQSTITDGAYSNRNIVAPNITSIEQKLTEAVPKYSTSDAGKNLAVNSSGNAVGWVKPQTIKFVDYKTDLLTFSSLADQKKIELSNFGPEVTEDNVLSFMVIYWSNIHVIAQADWSSSQGTGSSGMACALHSLNTGTGYAVIRCVYLA